MPETLTAPPVAPQATKTSAPPTGSPPPAKTPPAPSMEPNKGLQTPFDELDSMSIDAPPAEPKVEVPKVEPKVETPKEEPKVEDPDPSLIGEEETKVEAPKVEPEKPMGTAKELRAAFEKNKKELNELKKELETLKTGKTEDPEKKTLIERLQQEETKRKQIEQELGFASYEKSEEYKVKYQQPLQEAFKSAYDEVQQLSIETEEGSRKATVEDFNKLIYLPLQEAISLSGKLFGEASGEVLAHRRKVIEINKNRATAIEEHNKTRDERENQRSIAQAADLQNRSQLWDKSTKEQIEKYPQYFAAKEGDEEGNKILEKGFKIADLAFSNPDMPIDEKIKLNATIRNKAASFDRLALEHKRMNEKVKALEVELASFRKSEPGSGKGSTESVKVDSWQAELEQLGK